MSSGTTRVTQVGSRAGVEVLAAGDLGAGELAVVFFDAGDLAHDELHLVGFAQLFHLGHAGGRGLEAVAAVHQDHAFGFVGAVLHEIQCPVEGRVTTANDEQVFARKLRWVFDAVVQLRAVEFVEAIDAQQARLE